MAGPRASLQLLPPAKQIVLKSITSSVNRLLNPTKKNYPNVPHELIETEMTMQDKLNAVNSAIDVALSRKRLLEDQLSKLPSKLSVHKLNAELEVTKRKISRAKIKINELKRVEERGGFKDEEAKMEFMRTQIIKALEEENRIETNKWRSKIFEMVDANRLLKQKKRKLDNEFIEYEKRLKELYVESEGYGITPPKRPFQSFAKR